VRDATSIIAHASHDEQRPKDFVGVANANVYSYTTITNGEQVPNSEVESLRPQDCHFLDTFLMDLHLLT
jgi:hypothetical protein